MTSVFDIKWDEITDIKSHFEVPCLRFAAGIQPPVLTWLVPTQGPTWTMYVATYNTWEGHFDPPEKLVFEYLRARDVGVYTPGITPSIQLTQILGETLLVGTKTMEVGKGNFFSTSVMRRPLGRPAGTRELQDADYIFRSHGGTWDDVHPLILDRKGVCDISLFSRKNKIFLVGSTFDAKLGFSISTDGGKTWDAPALITQYGIHPVLAEISDGHLVAFYIKSNTQMKAGKDGDRMTISPTTGPLWYIDRDNRAKWSSPRELLDRMDILHCSACNDSEGKLYVAFDVYPEGPYPIVLGRDALFSGRPSSQIYVTHSSDRGQTWTEPVSVSSIEASYFSPEIALYEDKLIITAMRRESEGWSIVVAFLSIEDLRGQPLSSDH